MDFLRRLVRGVGRVLRAIGREIGAAIRVGGIASAGYNDRGRHADALGVAVGLDEVKRNSEDQQTPR